jgi:uncharacterized protein (TIGR03067 family)
MRNMPYLPLLASLLTLSLASLTPGLAGAEGTTGPETREGDGRSIQGRWRVVGFNREGREFSEDQLQRLAASVRFTGENVTQAASGDKGEDGSFTLDGDRKPKRLTITPKDGGHPQTMIYELDGDRLRLASRIGDGGNPPSDFEPRRGRVVMTLERQKE